MFQRSTGALVPATLRWVHLSVAFGAPSMVAAEIHRSLSGLQSLVLRGLTTASVTDRASDQFFRSALRSAPSVLRQTDTIEPLLAARRGKASPASSRADRGHDG